MIVKDIETLKSYIATVVGNDYDNDFAAYIKSANAWLITNVTGKALYDIAAGDSDNDLELRQHCEKIVSLNAYERAIPFLDLRQTNNGFAVVSEDNLLPASPQRVKALIEATKKEQDEAVENLLSGYDAATTALENLKNNLNPLVLVEEIPDGYLSNSGSGFLNNQTASFWIMEQVKAGTNERFAALNRSYERCLDVVKLIVSQKDESDYTDLPYAFDMERTAYFQRGPMAGHYGWQFMLTFRIDIDMTYE